MSGSPANADRVIDIAEAVFDRTVSDDELVELNAILLADPVSRNRYLDYCRMQVALRLELRSHRAAQKVQRQIGVEPAGPTAESDVDGEEPLSAIPPIVIDVSPGGRYPLGGGLFAVGGPLFSYAAATVITGMLVLGTWMYKVSLHGEVSLAKPAPASEHLPPQPVLVGRITATAECRWADGQEAPSAVPLGRTYELASGLVEIRYDTGATVILQGPCTYEVESARGGYLSLGKLTARVETKGEGGRGRAEEDESPKSEIRNPKSPFPLPPSAFVVRTPTAVVTDLGTEFGVEVDASGATQSHVFRGKVELRAAGDGQHSDAHPIPLGENESARVEAGQDRAVRVIRLSPNEARPGGFTRQMPRRVPIKVFNTGVGVNEGDEDPHWQIVARTDDPHFEPRPAVVTAVGPTCMPNDCSRSQWISTANHLPLVPDNVTYTFRTTFELADLLAGSAVLRGQFVVDDRVAAIRLNGQSVPMPEGDSGPHSEYRRFAAAKGFVEGVNTLEIDVYNGDPAYKDRPASSMALLVELEGSFVCAGRLPAAAEEKPAAADGTGTTRAK
jgi:hypothetical protein